MKHKQKEPRRVRPAGIPDELDEEASLEDAISDGVCHEPKPKRPKSDLAETPTENSSETTDSSQWKWNIADFRKEHPENTKEHLEDSNKQTKKSNEHSDQLEQLPNSSKDPPMDSKEFFNNLMEPCDNLELSKKSCNNSEESCDNLEPPNESSKCSEESLINTKEYEKNPEFPLRNPPQILRNHMGAAQGWKLPVRSLKEPSSYTSQTPPSSELNSNTNLPLKIEEKTNCKNELQNYDMPVILNVFSLSTGSAQAKQFVTNTRQENSVLFTPPCTPPLIQLGPFSAIPVSNQNSRFRNDVAKQAFQPFTSDTNEHWREYWYNKPVKQIHRNSQGYLSYQVQQVNSLQEYSNKPVQQVYYNPEYYLSKPVQQASSQQYLGKPLQQIYHNPQENSLKSVQQVNSQNYLNQSVQQVNHNPEYLSNPTQQTNPREYLYNPTEQINNYNPQQIANGVLPLAKQSSNQSTYATQIQPNSTPYYTQGYYDDVNNNEQTAISTPSNFYLVKRGNFLTKGNGMYSQFKLRQNVVENSRKYQQGTNSDILSQFFETPSASHRSDIYIPPIAEKTKATQRRSDIYIPSSGGATVIFSTPPSTIHSQNGGNVLPDFSNGASVGKYRTENGCSVVLDGYGRNRVLEEGEVNPSNSNLAYNAKLHHSENSYGSPTMDSVKQPHCSENSFGSPTLVPGSYGVESGNTAESIPEIFSPRDAKVMELKQRLEEQEATLKKLTASQ